MRNTLNQIFPVILGEKKKKVTVTLTTVPEGKTKCQVFFTR